MTTMPTKHVPLEDSLLGIGMTLIPMIRDAEPTVTELWTKARETAGVTVFDRFCEALVVLYSLGAVDLAAGRLRLTT